MGAGQDPRDDDPPRPMSSFPRWRLGLWPATPRTRADRHPRSGTAHHDQSLHPLGDHAEPRSACPCRDLAHRAERNRHRHVRPQSHELVRAQRDPRLRSLEHAPRALEIVRRRDHRRAARKLHECRKSRSDGAGAARQGKLTHRPLKDALPTNRPVRLALDRGHVRSRSRRREVVIAVATPVRYHASRNAMGFRSAVQPHPRPAR